MAIIFSLIYAVYNMLQKLAHAVQIAEPNLVIIVKNRPQFESDRSRLL